MAVALDLYEDSILHLDAALNHPFVLGIGDGTLPRSLFSRWIVQDWLYLHGYVAALEKASLMTNDATIRSTWQDLKKATVEEELALHRRLATKFDLSMDILDQALPFEATKDYLDTLEAASSDYSALIATLTPCAVGYAEIAHKLKFQMASTDPDYAEWIATYLDPAFQKTVAIFETEIDRCAQSEQALRVIQFSYRKAAQCELAFWNGLWRGY